LKTREIRTGELILVALEPDQLLALSERRQRACVTRANPVSLEKKNVTAGMSGTTILSVEIREYAPVNWFL
jgi:hypothetical protein